MIPNIPSKYRQPRFSVQIHTLAVNGHEKRGMMTSDNKLMMSGPRPHATAMSIIIRPLTSLGRNSLNMAPKRAGGLDYCEIQIIEQGKGRRGGEEEEEEEYKE
jgi:hypothetical protein